MCFGVAFYSFTIGNLTSLVSQIDTKEKALAQKIQYINSFAQEAHLPKEMRQRLRKVLEYNNTKISFESVAHKKEIFEELPLKLRCEVAMAMHHGALKTIHFFQNKDPTFIVAIVPLLKPLKASQQERIYIKGDPPSEIYFIIVGRVQFETDDFTFKEMVNGSYFGEIDVLFNQSRGYTARAALDTELLSLERNKFIDILDQYPEIADEVITLARARSIQIVELFQRINEARNSTNKGLDVTPFQNQSTLNQN